MTVDEQLPRETSANAATDHALATKRFSQRDPMWNYVGQHNLFCPPCKAKLPASGLEQHEDSTARVLHLEYQTSHVHSSGELLEIEVELTHVERGRVSSQKTCIEVFFHAPGAMSQ